MTTVLAGMLMPTASVSVANTAFTRPSTKHASTTSLNGGTIPAWWAATPASSWARNWLYPSTARSAGSMPPSRASTISRIRSRSSPVVNRAPAAVARRAASSHWLRLKMK